MKTAVDAGVEPSQVVCECGGDHRSIEARHCPVFNVLRDLNRSIQEFRDAQQVLEFGKDGPMAHCLRCAMLFEYGWMIRSLEHQKTMSERHPEWNLAEEISRLRRYAEQVSVGCAEEKKTLGPGPQPPKVEPIIGTEDKTLQYAKNRINWFYDTCWEIIEEFVLSGAESLSYMPDSQGYLAQIDNEFKEVFEAIIDLPASENATIQALTEKSYKIWKECRRLLCDSKRWGQQSCDINSRSSPSSTQASQQLHIVRHHGH